MEKARSKCRDISFRSEKNQKVVCVHSAMAREYARVLEQDPEVVSYEACYALDQERYQYVDPVDIRKDYFKVEWTTDFMVYFSDGRMGIREIVTESMLEKRANVEKLEFSRNRDRVLLSPCEKEESQIESSYIDGGGLWRKERIPILN